MHYLDNIVSHSYIYVANNDERSCLCVSIEASDWMNSKWLSTPTSIASQAFIDQEGINYVADNTHTTRPASNSGLIVQSANRGPASCDQELLQSSNSSPLRCSHTLSQN